MIQIEEIISIAESAGKEILKIYAKDFSVEYKDDNSPLTEADKASHHIIVSGLKHLDIPVLSEESREIPYEIRNKWSYYWLIDPLDGTKEFIKRNGEFTVNIALIRNYTPVLGVVNVPVIGITYYYDGKYSYMKNTEAVFQLPLKYKRESYVIVASRSHLNAETSEFIDRIGEKHSDVELKSFGSSLKLCKVAEGEADIYPRLAPTMEWDTAAAHAVVKGAGKNVYRYEDKQELIYNKENLLNPWFVVE